MKIALSIFFSLIIISAKAQQRWSAAFNQDTAFIAIGHAVCTDQSGDVLIGVTSGVGSLLKYSSTGNLLWQYSTQLKAVKKIICVGNDIYATGSLLDSIGQRMFFGKWDSNGNLLWLWKESLSPVGQISTGSEIKVDPSGNFVVASGILGLSLGTTFFVAKIDANGNELWNNNYTLPDSIENESSFMVLDNSGDIYLTKDQTATLSPFMNDVSTVLIKIENASGNILWTYTVRNIQQHFASTLATDVQNGNLVQLISTADNSFNSRIISMKYDLNGQLLDSIWLPDVQEYAAFNSSGEILTVSKIWAQDFNSNVAMLRRFNAQAVLIDSLQLTSPSGLFYPTLIKTDGAGNVYIAGSERGNDVCGANYQIFKADNSMNLTWSDSIDGGANVFDSPFDLFINSNGDVMVTGMADGVVTCGNATYAATAYWSNSIINSVGSSTNDNSFLIYPNPSDGSFAYNFDGVGFSKTMLKVFDSLGRNVFETEVHSSQGVVRSNLSPGIYTLQVEGGRSKRLVVK